MSTIPDKAQSWRKMYRQRPDVKREAASVPCLRNAKERKAIPIATGVLDYFPHALIEIAKVSKVGNDQHNPGEPLHWSRGKSTDQEDTIIRHFMERGKTDVDGVKHLGRSWHGVYWRCCNSNVEAEGAPLARGAKL